MHFYRDAVADWPDALLAGQYRDPLPAQAFRVRAEPIVVKCSVESPLADADDLVASPLTSGRQVLLRLAVARHGIPACFRNYCLRRQHFAGSVSAQLSRAEPWRGEMENAEPLS